MQEMLLPLVSMEEAVDRFLVRNSKQVLAEKMIKLSNYVLRTVASQGLGNCKSEKRNILYFPQALIVGM